MNSEEIVKGIRHLRRADPVMGALIRKAGPFELKRRKDRFHALVSSIISQQISGSAARSIRQRLFDHVAPEKLTAENLCCISPDVLRELGLSRQKAIYLLDLANRVACGELKLPKMARLTTGVAISGTKANTKEPSMCYLPRSIPIAWTAFPLPKMAIISLVCRSSYDTELCDAGLVIRGISLQSSGEDRIGRSLSL